MAQTTYEFKADIPRLMDLIIHSFYSKKEIFLRELISNASDALDKARFGAGAEAGAIKTREAYGIRISVDKEGKVLGIEDDGIGMSDEDLRQNLSTIAHSGTAKFLEEQGKGEDMIGQFGVGFYSAFLVANRVDVLTRKKGGKLWQWSSDAQTGYSVEEKMEEDMLKEGGTKILLHMKEEDLEFLEVPKIREIIKTHSQFIEYPILMWEKKPPAPPASKEEEEEVVEESEETESTTPKVEEVEVEEEKKVVADEYEWTAVNNTKPIWYQKPQQPTEEEYGALYKTLSVMDWDNPLYYRHFEAEGQLEFRGILYIPKRPPFDFAAPAEKKKTNIRLYVKKVLITEHAKELIPEWMSFVTGVIDSSDLPLNVSREMLQHNHVVSAIRRHLTKHVMEMISEMTKDPEKYPVFYENFRKHLKQAVYEENQHADKIASFLRFTSNQEGDKVVSLDEYLESTTRKKYIYYLAGENLAILKTSVLMDRLNDTNIPVLYLVDPIDEFMIKKLQRYKDAEFVNVGHESFELDDNEISEEDKEDATAKKVNKMEREEARKKKQEEKKELLEFMQSTLKGKIEKVKVSDRLSKFPSCIVTEGQSWSSNMERIMNAQTMGDDRSHGMMKAKKVLEINPSHPLVQRLEKMVVNSDTETEADKEESKRLIHLLADVSLLTSGFTIDNPSDFAQNVYQLL